MGNKRSATELNRFGLLTKMISFTALAGIVSALIVLPVAGGIGLLVYMFICWILKLEEMHRFFGSLKRRWLKLTNVQGEIGGADEI